MKRILYVLHSGITGGTFLTNKDLMKNVVKEYDIFLLGAEKKTLLLFKYSNGNLSLIKEYPRKSKWSAKKFHDSWMTYIYFDILINFNIDLVHIRHFINHSFDLPEVAKKLNIPVIVSLHDFYLICPFYVLLNENIKYCKGICSDNISNCYNSLDSLNDIYSKELIPKWRNEVSKMIRFIDYFITTSDFVKDLFLSVYPQIDDFNFQVIEHGRDFSKIGKYNGFPSKDTPIKILCPANYLNILKGSDIIKQIKQEDEDGRIEFHFLGNCRDGVEEFGISHGTFERDEFYKKVREIKPSFIGIFSIWPETFCHTLTEAWSCGIPVLGSNIGVIQDRILKEKGGWLVDINNPKEIYKRIIDISENIEEYENKLKNIDKIYLKNTKAMSNEYLDVYSFFLDKENYFGEYVDSNDIIKNKYIIKESELFDESYYLSSYSDVKKNKLDPLYHWVKWGYIESFRNPNPKFSNSFYTNEYLSDIDEKWNPLTHYEIIGKKKGYKRNIYDSPILEHDRFQIPIILNALNKKISIILFVFNYSDEIKNCLKSIFKNTFIFFEIIILIRDNSCDELYSYIDNLNNANISILVNNTQKNFFEFVNETISNITTDVVLLNAYSEVPSKWLSNLIIKAYSDKDIGFVSPLSNFLVDVNPFEKNNYNSLTFTVDGINTLSNKSADNKNLILPFSNVFCLFIKNESLSSFNFKKELIKYNPDLSNACINLKESKWKHILDNSTYVYYNPKFFIDNKDILIDLIDNSEDITEFLESFPVKQLNHNLSKAIEESNYNVLSNRLLFVTNYFFKENLFNDNFKKLYDCYFLINDGKKIILLDDTSKIKSWNITKHSNNIINNEYFKQIYFDILYSLKIDLVQIDDMRNNSFDLREVCKSLNIPIIVNCIDDYYISNNMLLSCSDDFKYKFKQESLKLFKYGEVIISCVNLKENYLSIFPEIQNSTNIIYDTDLISFNKKFIKKDLDKPIKIFIPGNLSLNSNDLKFLRKFITFDVDNQFEFHFLGDIPYFLDDFGINHGFFDENIFNEVIDEINPDFVGIFNVFQEIFFVIDQSVNKKIPILVKNNEYLLRFIENVPGVVLLNCDSCGLLFKSIFNHIKMENYNKILKELFYNDSDLRKSLIFITQEYINLYLKYEKNIKISSSESLLKNSIEEKTPTFSDFKGFLSNSYVSPIIKAPFIEEDKRCFAVMDNIAKYLMKNANSISNPPLISVIMPVYNGVDSIESAIDSVLNQSYKNIELIVVDDGSTDGTRNLLRTINDDRIHLIFHEFNKGVSCARNTALKHANGSLIAYLDSDNLWDYNFVEAMVGSFLELPDAHAVYSGQLLYHDSDKPFAVRFGSFNKSLLNNKNYIDMNCFCHKIEVYKEIGGFNEKLNRLVDWEFILRVKNLFKIYSIPVLFSKYYFSSQNRISNFSSGNIGIRNSNRNYIQYIQEKNKPSIKDLNFRLNHKVNIIIPNYESLYDLRECVNSILSLKLGNKIKIIIVDNNSNNAVRFYLENLKQKDNIQIIQNDVNYGFDYAVNQGIVFSDSDSDILILNNNAVLTKNAIEIMQNAAYNLKKCGIVVPQQILPAKTHKISAYVPYAAPDFECDVNPSYHHKNIINIPIFYDGEILELNFAPFFCVYIKREVLNNSFGLGAKFGRHYRSDIIFSEYVRNVLKLKIYHVSDAFVYRKL